MFGVESATGMSLLWRCCSEERVWLKPEWIQRKYKHHTIGKSGSLSDKQQVVIATLVSHRTVVAPCLIRIFVVIFGQCSIFNVQRGFLQDLCLERAHAGCN